MMATKRLSVAIVQLRGTSVVGVRPQQAQGLVALDPGRRRLPIALSLLRFPFQPLPSTSSRHRHRHNRKYLLARRQVLNNNIPKYLSRPSMARRQLGDMLMPNITGIMGLVTQEVRQTLACTVATWACHLQVTRTLAAQVRAVNRWVV